MSEAEGPRPRSPAAAFDHVAGLTGVSDAARSVLAPARWSRWLVPALAVALAVGVLDLMTARFAVLAALLVLPPLLCALVGRWADTAAVGALSVALSVVVVLSTNANSAAEVIAVGIVLLGGLLAILIALLRAATEVSFARVWLLGAVADVSNEALGLDDGVARLLGILTPAFADVALVDTTLGGSHHRLGARASGAGADAIERALLRDPAAAADVLTGATGSIVVPLRARGEAIGVLSVFLTASRRTYSRSDLAFAEIFAGRVAVVFDNIGLTSELSAAERQLELALDGLAEAVTVTDAAGRSVYANNAAVELLRLDSAQQLIDATPGEMMDLFEVSDEDGNPVGLEQLPGFRVRAGEPDPEPLLVRNVVKATGEERWLLNKATTITDAAGRIVRVVNVIEDLTVVKRTELEQRLLAAASDALASSLDYEQTLQRVADVAVPMLADWCGVELPGSDGVVRSVAAAHGTQVRDAAHLEQLRASGVASLVVPLTAGSEMLGTLTLVRTDPRRRFDARDRQLAEELGRRAGTAVLNARLYTERSAIAATLQRGLRPPELRASAGFEVATHYRAAGEFDEVGGDFYDAFPAEDGWMVVIGDVTGHGAGAAALTALARYTLRSAGQLTGDPARAAQQLNATLRDLPRLSLCSAVCAYLRADPVAMVTLANCGHPRPLLLRDAAIRELGEPGPIAGAFDDGEWARTSVELRAGDTLLLCTDGVVDMVGGDGRFGEERLHAALRAAPSDPHALIAHIAAELDAFQQGDQRDDTALVALRYLGV